MTLSQQIERHWWRFKHWFNRIPLAEVAAALVIILILVALNFNALVN